MPLEKDAQGNPFPNGFYEPEEESLGKLLDIYRPDDDVELRAYMAGTVEAVAKVRDALHKPYFLCPEPYSHEMGFSYIKHFKNLGHLMIAHGLLRARRSDADEEMLDFLLDAERLGRLMLSDGGDYPALNAFALQRLALKTLTAVLHRTESPALLALANERLRGLVNQEPSLKPCMTSNLRVLVYTPYLPGDTPHFIRVLKELGPLGDAADKLRMARFQKKVIAFVQENADQILEASDLPYPQYKAWSQSNQGLFENSYSYEASPTRGVAWKAQYLAQLRGALIAVALERVRIAHGEYLDELQALQPGFLGVIPLDPFTEKPFKYEHRGAGCLLYSVGATGWAGGAPDDDGGDNERDMVILSPASDPVTTKNL